MKKDVTRLPVGELAVMNIDHLPDQQVLVAAIRMLEMAEEMQDAIDKRGGIGSENLEIAEAFLSARAMELLDELQRRGFQGALKFGMYANGELELTGFEERTFSPQARATLERWLRNDEAKEARDG